MRTLLVVVIACAAAAAAQQCDVASDGEKFDCHPENGATQEKCGERGCCWINPTAVEGTVKKTVPTCFFPKDYQGYKLVNQSATSFGLTAFLERVKDSKVDEDIKLLQIDVIKQADSILRIRIIDPTTKRWEPPMPEIPAPLPNIKEKYTYLVSSDPRLSLKVSRADDSKTTLVDFDLASLIYTDRFIQLSSKLPSDAVFGLGEHKGPIRKSVQFTTLSFWNSDASPTYNTRLYGYHPLYINIEKDGRANGMWIFNSNAMDIILQPTPAITYRPIGGVLDFFVFVGDTPAKVVQQYQQTVGKPKMIPYWSLGFHLCRWGYKNVEHTQEILKKNLDAGVRIDVQWNDIDYMNDNNGFTLDPVNYKDLKSFVESIHKDGRHYVMIVDPAVSGSEPAGEYPPFDRGLDYDVFVKDINGTLVRGRVWNVKTSAFPDFTHPNATAYWTELFSNFHEEVGFDGAWIDMNEPANLIDGHVNVPGGCRPEDRDVLYTPGDKALISKTLCTSDKHHWSEHYNIHNMYGFTEAIATYKALSTVRPNKRPFIISRSSFSGHGFHAGHWTGDILSTWTDLKDSVPGIMEFSLYGMPMVGADICGFANDTTEELCARWQALGAFYPFSRNHNSNNTIAQDPASMGGKVLEVTKNTLAWRYRLLPYLYTLFYKAHVYGETVMRPLFLDYPEDPKTYDNDEQFLWGDSLMVVPALTEGQTTIDAYFPKGVWYDLQNRTASNPVDASAEGLVVQLTAHEDTINFFMKGGKAVFFQEPGLTTTDSRQNPFGVYIFLQDGVAAGDVYIDDGESIDAIDKRAYSVISAIANEKAIQISNNSGSTNTNKLEKVHVYGIKTAPKSILVNYKAFTDFVYDDNAKLLSIYNINIEMQGISILLNYQ